MAPDEKENENKKESGKEKIIVVRNIRKEFEERKRGAGFKESLKALFSRKYEIKAALKNVSLEIEKGEIVGLIGPNGAGKSTLIKILTGVLYPTKGYANILGFIPWKDRVKYVKNIGVIFGQKSQLWWDIPALDTFELHRELYGIPKKEFEARRDYMIKALEIGEVVKKQVRQLSLGERMRCELVLALLHNPKIAFLDEPTIGLDIIAKERIRDFIVEFNRKYQTTFIITTHDMADIERLCRRIIMINHGRIIYDGLLAKVRKDFANSKVVECKFFSPLLITEFKFTGTKILKTAKHNLVLEIDLSKAKISDLVYHILKRFGNEIEDIDIEEPPIEEIIKLMYQRRE